MFLFLYKHIFSSNIFSKKILRYTLFFTIFFLMLFGGLVSWGYFFLSPSVKKYLEETISTQSDSLYQLRIENLKINLLSGKIWAKNIYFEPRETHWRKKFGKNQSPPLAKIYVKSLEVNHWSWWAYYWHKNLKIEQIYLEKVDIFYQKNQKLIEDKNQKPIFDEKIIEKIAKKWNIKDVFIKNADFSLKIFQKGYVWTHSGKNLHLNTKNIHFENKKWQIKGFKGGFARYTAHTPQGDYIYHAENLGISSLDSTLSLRFFKIIPKDDPNNAIKFGFQRLTLTGIQYFNIIPEQKLSFHTLKCEEVEAIFPKIPDFFENSKNDTLKKYNFFQKFPLAIAWENIEGEKINLYAGNWQEKYEKNKENPQKNHFYIAKKLKIFIKKGSLKQNDIVFPKEINIFASQLEFQKEHQEARGENLEFSLKNQKFSLNNLVFLDKKNLKKIQFESKNLIIKGFPTFEHFITHINNPKNPKNIQILQFNYVGIDNIKFEWLSQIMLGQEKTRFKWNILPNVQLDTLHVLHFAGKISPYPQTNIHIGKAQAYMYGFRKEKSYISVQNMEILGERLAFYNQKNNDTLYAKRVHFKKNPATLTLNDWEGNITQKSNQIQLKGQKNIIQLKNLEEFITQKKWHFAYIYTQNTHINLIHKIIEQKNILNNNFNDNQNNIPFALPSPVEIDSFVVKKAKVDANFFLNNQPKNSHSLKELNAKILKIKIEKDFLETKNLFVFGENSNIEILEYKGDFSEEKHQILAKKIVFDCQKNMLWAENLQTIPYQNNYLRFFEKNPQTNLFLDLKIQNVGIKNFLNNNFFTDFFNKKSISLGVLYLKNAKTNIFIKINQENQFSQKSIPNFNLDTLNAIEIDTKIHFLTENQIKTQIETKANAQIIGLSYPLKVDILNGILSLKDNEIQSEDFCVKVKEFDFNSFSKIVLFKDVFAENYQKNQTNFKLFAKNADISGLDISALDNFIKKPEKNTQKVTQIKQINVKNIEILNGFLELKNMLQNVQNKYLSEQKQENTRIFEKLKKDYFGDTKIDTISAKNMRFSYQKEYKNGENESFLNEQNIFLDKIAFFEVCIDTNSTQISAKNFKLLAKNYESNMDFGLYQSKIKDIFVNSFEKKIILENIEVKPIFSPEIVAYHRGKQADIWENAFEKVEVNDWNWVFLQEKQGIKANTIIITGANYLMYKDKRRDLPDKPALLLNERWQKITIPLQIDTLISKKNAFFYTEFAPKAGTETGYIYFSEINGKIFPLHNIHKNPTLDTNQHTQIIMEAKLMSEGQTELSLEIPFNQKNFFVNAKGNLGKMNAKIFNMFLEHTQHIRIKRGRIKEVRFDMQIQHTHATGTLHASYKNLYVQVLGKKNIEKKRRFISFLANLIIKNRNNAERKHAKVGKIDYKKLPHEGFGLFFGKSIGTGLKDTLK